MKLISHVFAWLLIAPVAGAAVPNEYAGMNLAEGNAIQIQGCSLQPRKSMSDHVELINDYIEWSKENDVEVLVMRGTPVMGGPNPDSGPDFQWFEMLISPYSVIGAGWDKWLSTEEGQELNERWQETSDCRVSVNPGFLLHLNAEAMAADTRIMTFNWCTRREGVTWDQLNAQHSAMAANLTNESPMKSWGLMFPELGSRNPLGEFAHIASYANMSGLMASQNVLVNEEGWRRREDYFTLYASCTGPNVYHVEVLNRP